MRVAKSCKQFRNRLLSAVAVQVTLAVVCAAQSQPPTSQAPPTSVEAEQSLPALIRSVEGPQLFRAYCASCHGTDAKGKGPAATALKVPPPDLTQLAKRNRGNFPEVRVRKAITGEEVLAAHGSREMPIWGPILHQIEADVDRGNVRLDNLVKYLRSIQAQ